MRTIIFILALTTLAVPALTAGAAGDAITCEAAGTANNCNMCLEGSPAGTKTDKCFDCKAGYFLTYDSANKATTGTCTRCAAGKGIAVGTAANGDAGSTRPASSTGCTASCHTTCAECFDTTSGSCTKCQLDTFAPTYTATGSACSGTCSAGTTRTANAVLSANEQSSVCNGNCDSSCSTCRGTAASGCTKCVVGRYATSFAAATSTATCSACDAGTTREVAANAFTNNEDKATTCVACHTSCATCYGTGATKCTKCKADTYATAPTAAATPAPAMATCTACDVGTFRTAPADNVPATAEAKTVCNVGCDATCAACKGTPKSCTKCAVGHYLSAKAADADDFGTCTACTGGKGRNADADAFTAASKAATNDAACTATCTPASNCGSCSAVAADAGKCLTCPTDYKLDTTANTCTKAAAPNASSASLLQALCGASVAAYALF